MNGNKIADSLKGFAFCISRFNRNHVLNFAEFNFCKNCAMSRTQKRTIDSDN